MTGRNKETLRLGGIACRVYIACKPATGEVWTNPLFFVPNPNNYYPLLTLPILTHTQWITSFVLDSIHTQSIICTLPISSMDNYFLLIPSPFEVGVDLNMDNG
jgi:hypothetical protein